MLTITAKDVQVGSTSLVIDFGSLSVLQGFYFTLDLGYDAGAGAGNHHLEYHLDCYSSDPSTSIRIRTWSGNYTASMLIHRFLLPTPVLFRFLKVSQVPSVHPSIHSSWDDIFSIILHLKLISAYCYPSVRLPVFSVGSQPVAALSSSLTVSKISAPILPLPPT